MKFTTRFTLALMSVWFVSPVAIESAAAYSSARVYPVQWGGGGGDQQAADNALRMNRIEEQLRQMNGRNEELMFKIQRLEDQLKRLQEDTDFRLQDLENKGSGGNHNAPPQRRSSLPDNAAPSSQQASNSAAQQGAPAPGERNLGELINEGPIMSDGRQSDPMVLSPSSSGTQVAAIQGANASDDYALGVGFLQRREYDYAEAQFTQFIQQYPGDANIAGAFYGLGESYFYRKRYNDALENYLKVVQSYGSSSKAPESLLRLGTTLAAINEKQQGCAALAEVGRKYPNAASVKSQASRESKRIGC